MRKPEKTGGFNDFFLMHIFDKRPYSEVGFLFREVGFNKRKRFLVRSKLGLTKNEFISGFFAK